MSNSEAQLEERKFALDAEIRRREMTLKEAEVGRAGISVAQATVVGAVLTLLGGTVGSLITASSSQGIESNKDVTSLKIEESRVKKTLNLEKSKQEFSEELERQKFETSLIFEAIKAPSRNDAIRNLKFFVAAGFISDSDGKIARLDDGSLPSLSQPSPESAARALEATGIIRVLSEGDELACTGTAISPWKVVTASFCVGDPAMIASDSPVQEDKGATRSIEFHSMDGISQLKIDNINHLTGLATLIVVDTELSIYLDPSIIRSSTLGERVYLVTGFGGQGAAELRTCQINSFLDDGNFEHSCVTGVGSAGAVVIAVSDNALLGIHHSKSLDGSDGVASALAGGL